MSADKYQIVIEVDERGAVTGMTRLGSAVDQTSAKVGQASRTMEVLNGVVGAQVIERAARATVDFLKESSQAAAEEDAVYRGLQNTVENLGVSWGVAGGQLGELFASIQETTRYGDDVSAKTFDKLIGITQNYDASMIGLRASIDLAAGAHMPLETAAELMGKAINGNVTALQGKGITLDYLEKRLLATASAEERATFFAEEFSKRFGGAAQAEMETASGQIQRLGNYYGDLKEAIGRAINAQMFSPDKVQPLVDALQYLTDHVHLVTQGFEVSVQGFEVSVVAVELVIAKAVAAVTGYFSTLATNAAKIARVLHVAVGPAEDLAEWFADAAKTADSTAEALEERLDDLTATFGNVAVAAGKTAGAIGGGGGGGKPSLASSFSTLEAAVDEALVSARAWQTTATQLQLGAEDFFDAGIEGDVATIVQGITDAIDDELGTWTPEAPQLTQNQLWQAAAREWADDASWALSSGLTDAITGVFDGDWTDVAESFTSQFTGLWQQGFTEAIHNLGSGHGFTTGTYNPETGLIEGGSSTQAWASGLGMVGSAASSYGQQSGNQGMGIAGGALSGAAMGIPYAGATMGWSVVIGAVVGGVMGYLSTQGEDTPETGYTLSETGAHIVTRGGQGMSEADWIGLERSMNSLFRATRMQMLETVSIFQRPELFGELGALPSASSGEYGAGWTQGTAQDIMQQLTQTILPDLFESWAGQAIGSGLSFYGVSSEAIDTLWDELGQLTGSDRISALQTYLQAVVDSARLLERLDQDEVNRVVGQSPMEAMADQVAAMYEGFAVSYASVQGLDYVDLAPQADEVFATISSALDTWLSMIRQIDAEEQAMHRSIAAQREGIAVAGMTGDEQASYYAQQIQSLMGQLRGGEGDTAQIVGDIQRYVSAMQQLGGDQLWQRYDWMTGGGAAGADVWAGQYSTMAEYLDAVLGEVEGLASGRYAESRGQLMDYVDNAAIEVDRWRELLGIANDALEDDLRRRDIAIADEGSGASEWLPDAPVGGGGGGGGGDRGPLGPDTEGEGGYGWKPTMEGSFPGMGKAISDLAAAVTMFPIQVTLSADSRWLASFVDVRVDARIAASQAKPWVPKSGGIG